MALRRVSAPPFGGRDDYGGGHDAGGGHCSDFRDGADRAGADGSGVPGVAARGGCAGIRPQRSAPVVCAEAGLVRGAGLNCGRVFHRWAADAGVAVADHGSNLAHGRS